MTDPLQPDLPPRPAWLPEVITDLATVERRARDLTDQNLRFRTWTKVQGVMRDAELDAVVRETADEVWRHIDCTACGMCCTMPSIAVNHDDTAALARRLDMRHADFRRKYVSIYEGEAGITGPCPFLRGKRCSVYTDRPKTCRSFPYLHVEGFSTRMYAHISNAYFCPIVFNTLEALKRRLPWRGRGRGRR